MRHNNRIITHFTPDEQGLRYGCMLPTDEQLWMMVYFTIWYTILSPSDGWQSCWVYKWPVTSEQQCAKCGWKALTFSMALSTILQKRNDCFTLWIYDYGIRLQAYQQYDIWPMQASGWIQARPNQENTRQWLTAVFLSRRSPFTRLACLRCFRSIHSNIIYWQKNSLRDNNETHETTTVAAIAVRSPARCQPLA